jgi:hypothetical protein
MATPKNTSADDAAGKGKMSPEQQRHHDELYNYKRDEEGTLDTSEMLDTATSGQPNTPTTGPDPEESQVDELRDPGFNNPIDDNNR